MPGPAQGHSVVRVLRWEQRRADRVSAWLPDLHDNLLVGQAGRRVNGIGAIFVLRAAADRRRDRVAYLDGAAAAMR